MQSSTKSPRPKDFSRSQQVQLLLLYLGGIVMVIMSLHYFQHKLTGIFHMNEKAVELWYRTSLRLHILFGMTAILLGPIQFYRVSKRQSAAWHKRLGYAYALSVYISGGFGLFVAQFAMGGMMSRLGFTTLAVVWLYSISTAITTIRKGKVVEHRKWMMVNYALTFGAVPQRLWLLMAFIPGMDFMQVYRWSAWIPWIVSLVVAWQLSKRKQYDRPPFAR